MDDATTARLAALEEARALLAERIDAIKAHDATRVDPAPLGGAFPRAMDPSKVAERLRAIAAIADELYVGEGQCSGPWPSDVRDALLALAEELEQGVR